MAGLVSMTKKNDAPETLPPLREELRLFPGPREADGTPTWTLYDPVRHAFFRIGLAEFEMLSRWESGNPSLLLESIHEQTSLDVDESHLTQLLLFLSANELLQVRGEGGCARLDESARRAKKSPGQWLLHNYLFFRIPIVRPDRFLSATLSYVLVFFRRGCFQLTLAAGLIGLFLAARQWDAFRATFLHFFTLSGLFFYGAALLLAKIAHELGHAYTARRYGVRVPTMGIAFLVLWPLLYTDTTDAWKLSSHRQRRAIVMAGMAVELGLACYATLLWSLLPDGTARSAVFLLATATWITSLFFNANPFMRFDGYYLLSDTVGIANLQPRAFALGRWWLRRLLFGVHKPPPETLPERTRGWMILYAFSTWLYRFLLYAGIALLVYFLFFKVLGIFLFFVEVGWFLARPVYQELRAWWGMRDDIRWNPHTCATLAVVIALFGILIFPWQRDISAPAVLRATAHAAVYPRVTGRLEKVRVHDGDAVHAGDVMFELASPELDWQLKRASQQLDEVEIRLRRRAADAGLLSRSMVLHEQYAKAVTVYQGVLERHRELTVRAPINGIVTDMMDGLYPGCWLNGKHRMALVVDRGRAEIRAYVREGEIGRIHVGATGRFYAEQPGIAPLTGAVSDVGLTDVRELDDASLASNYGGALPVEKGKHGRVTLHGGYYRLRIRPVPLHTSPDRVVRGTFRVSADTISLPGRIWRKVASVLIRESGF